MKITSIKSIILAALLCGAIWSCKKEENQVILTGGTAPKLVASYNGDSVLDLAKKDQSLLSFSWTAPEYQLNTGVSSHDVTYLIEVSEAGTDFKRTSSVSVANDFSYTMTVGEFNKLLANPNELALTPDVPHNIDVRVSATINGSAKLPSNSFRYKGIVPYEEFAVKPPATGRLYMIGDAAPSGWNNPINNSDSSTQKFTRIDKGHYELSVALPGGGGYKIIQENGVWSTQYHMLTGGTWDTGKFELKDSDPQFPGPPTAGNYKISFDFKKGTYTVVKL